MSLLLLFGSFSTPLSTGVAGTLTFNPPVANPEAVPLGVTGTGAVGSLLAEVDTLSLSGVYGIGKVTNDTSNYVFDFRAGVLDPQITFTRASNGTYFDATGTLQTATNNTPRFDYDPATGRIIGLLMEEARTNSIRNPRAEGASAGSPGTLPTNWQVGSIGTLTRTISVGTESGIPYIDIRFNGTTSTTSLTINFEPATQIAALTAQTWSHSAYLKLSAGSLSNVTSQLIVLQEYTSGGAFIIAHTQTFTPTGDNLNIQRNSLNTTLSGGATTAFVQPYIKFNFSSGVAVDFTIRIGVPQAEQGNCQTTVILPPIGTPGTSTRAVEKAGITPLPSWWYNSGGDFSIAVDYDSVKSTLINNGQALALSVSNVFTGSLYVEGAGTVFGTPGPGLVQQPGSYIVGGNSTAFSVSASQIILSNNGFTPTVSGTGAAYTYNDMYFGGSWAGSASLDGHVIRVRIWTFALNSASVQQNSQPDLSVLPNPAANPLGVAGSGQVGSLFDENDTTLTGIAGTSVLYIPGVEIDVTLTGVSTTGQFNPPLPNPEPTPLGVTGTGAVGSLTPNVNAFITGVAGTGAAGSLTSGPSGSISGVSTTININAPGVEIDISLTGVAGTGQVGSLTNEVDAFITGVAGTSVLYIPGVEIDVTLTGVAGTGAVGTLSKEIDITLSGVAGTGQVGSLIGDPSGVISGVSTTININVPGVEIDITPLGVSGTGQVGILTTESDASVTLVGVSANGQVGTLFVEIDKTLIGVAGTGQAGSLADENDKTLTGVVGTGTVGGLITEVDKTLNGVAGTGQVGSLSDEIDTGILTGVSASGQVGGLFVEIDVTLLGVSGNGQVGNLAPETDVFITGVSATGQAGSLIPEIDVVFIGVSGTGDVGNLAQNSGAPIGVFGTGQVGILTTESDTSTTLVGVSATGTVGDLIAEVDAFPVTGVSAFGAVGTLSINQLTITGVFGTGQVGNVIPEVDLPIGIGVSGVGLVGVLGGNLPPGGGEISVSVNILSGPMAGLFIGPLGLINSTSSHGGVIITAASRSFGINRQIARVTDLHSCPIHGHGITPIITGSDTIFCEGLAVVVVGYSQAGCGAIINGNGAG